MMRKSFILFPVFLFICFSGMSQEPNKKSAFGIRAGVNIANVRWKIGGVGGHERPILAMNGGVYYSRLLSQRFSIQPELMYSNTGAIFTNKKILFNYLNVPVLLKFHPGKSDFSFFAGPQCGFLVKAKERRNIGREETTVTDDFAKTNFSLVLGIEAGLSRVNLGARYDFGISDVSDSWQVETLRTRTLSFNLGFRIL